MSPQISLIGSTGGADQPGRSAHRLPAVNMDIGDPGSEGDDYDDADYDDEDGYDDDGYLPPRSRWKWVAIVAAVVVLVGVGLGLGLTLSGGSSSDAVGPEGVPLQQVSDLASPNSTVSGAPVDGMTCRRTMVATDPYHVHAHVAIFVNGQQVRIPAGAGIVPPRVSQQLPGGTFVDAGNTDCLYWLHVHANDGIIHIESPTKQSFFLGQFFDVWGQPLGPNQVGPMSGNVVAFENGKVFTGNPRDIPLLPQAVIQLDVGEPVVPFKPMTFKVTGECSTSCSALPSS
jgi:hypothetical protein